jgi:hypothetical protein
VKYGYTPARWGFVGFSQPELALPLVPPGAEVAGMYHTHGNYTKYSGGKWIAATPAEDYRSDEWSRPTKQHIGDIAVAHEYAKIFKAPEFRSYLGTPGNIYRWYDVFTKQGGVLK